MILYIYFLFGVLVVYMRLHCLKTWHDYEIWIDRSCVCPFKAEYIFKYSLMWDISILYGLLHWMTHPLVLRVIPGPSPSPSEHVFVRIIIKSVRMLGRRTFGETTPHASLSRRLMESVTFFERFDGTCGGNVHGDPKAVQTRLWWLGAISGGKLAALNSSKKRSSTCCSFLAEHSTNTHCESWLLQYAMASSFCTVLSWNTKRTKRDRGVIRTKFSCIITLVGCNAYTNIKSCSVQPIYCISCMMLQSGHITKQHYFVERNRNTANDNSYKRG